MSAHDHLSEAQLGAFVQRTKEHGGASMSPRTGNFVPPGVTAYMVGGHPDKAGNEIPSKTVPADEFGVQHAREYVGHVMSVVDPVDRSARIGSWHNTDDNKVYLDVSSHMLDRDQAVAEGKKRNQLAVWDNKNMDEIPTGGNGKNDK